MEDHEPAIIGQHSGALCLHTTVCRALRTPVAVDRPSSATSIDFGAQGELPPRFHGCAQTSWRGRNELARHPLGVARLPGSPYTHNSQNTQNSVEPGNCADIADSAYEDGEMDERRLHNGSDRSSIGAERKRDTDALRRLILTRVLLSPPKPARGRVRDPALS